MKVKLTEQQFRRVIMEQYQDPDLELSPGKDRTADIDFGLRQNMGMIYNPGTDEWEAPSGGGDFVGAMYQQVVSAAYDWGTDPDKIVLAISKLENLNEIHDFLSRFKGKQTGYSSFNKMINGEYDQWNLSDILKLGKVLGKWGKVFYNTGAKPITGQKVFAPGSFKFTPSDKRVELEEGELCAQIYQDQLPKAVKWWKDWLNDPITQQKFKKNHKFYSDGGVKVIFNRYKRALDKAYIFPYFNDKETTIAYVQQKIVAPERIWVNCSQSKYYETDQEALETLIHELQHQLHWIHPLNPDKQIGDLFVGPNTNKLKPQDFTFWWDKNILGKSSAEEVDEEYESIETDIKKLMSLEEWRRTVKRLSLELNSQEENTASWLSYWYQKSLKKKKGDPNYSCDASEKGSNIASIRNILKLKPARGLTIEMLKPYILGNKGSNDMGWLLRCWAGNGFVDLKSFVSEFNELADNLTTGEEEIEYPMA
jgi:hypothetical protein